MKDNFKLANGVLIPSIGFGTWKVPAGEVAEKAVKEAIDFGYRLIDGAAVYGNEVSVGKGIKASGIAREELFVTSKVWNSDRGYETTLKAFEKTLADLQLDYLDLYLIHWPANSKQFDNWDEINKETWRALIELYKSGKVRSIGVSNFLPMHLKSLLKMEVVPMVNQIEFHPGEMQCEIKELCDKYDILIEAYSPLGSGRILEDETLTSIAAKHKVTNAQICLAWCLENNTLPLPRSVNSQRIKANLDIKNIKLTSEDIQAINNITDDTYLGCNPDQVDF